MLKSSAFFLGDLVCVVLTVAILTVAVTPGYATSDGADQGRLLLLTPTTLATESSTKSLLLRLAVGQCDKGKSVDYELGLLAHVYKSQHTFAVATLDVSADDPSLAQSDGPIATIVSEIDAATCSIVGLLWNQGKKFSVFKQEQEGDITAEKLRAWIWKETKLPNARINSHQLSTSGKDEDPLLRFQRGSAHKIISIYDPTETLSSQFAPVFEDIVDTFHNERVVPGLSFYQAHAKTHADLLAALDIAQAPSLPMIVYIAKGGDDPIHYAVYDGPLDPDHICRFINLHAGTHRLWGGGLDTDFGRNAELDDLARRFVHLESMSRARSAVLRKASKILLGIRPRLQAHAPLMFYRRVMMMYDTRDSMVLEKRLQFERRLEGLNKLSMEYSDTAAKLNILNVFETDLDLSGVFALNEANIGRVINGTSTPALVLFCMEWNSDCRDLRPAFAQVGAHFDPSSDDDTDTEDRRIVVIAAVDISVDGALAGRFDVQVFPTIKWFPQGRSPADRPMEIPTYSGLLAAKAITGWVEAQLQVKQEL